MVMISLFSEHIYVYVTVCACVCVYMLIALDDQEQVNRIKYSSKNRITSYHIIIVYEKLPTLI